MFRVLVAKKAGACYGVERALRVARKALAESTVAVHTLGPLIHNPFVVESLAKNGASAIEQPEDAKPGSVLVMRAHGVSPSVEARAKAAGLVMVDATCPFVKKVHHAVERLESQGYQVIVVGEKGHPEVEGACGHASAAIVVGESSELESMTMQKKVGVVAQTTLERRVLREVVAALIGRCEEIRVIDTICEATSERQQAAARLASQVDVMIVAGGRGSANTRHLADVCAKECTRTHHVECAEELLPEWFYGAESVGITAGASTPSEQIDAVVERLTRISHEQANESSE